MGTHSHLLLTSDRAADVKLAIATGVDAFALNVGGDMSDPTQLDLAYSASEALGFKVFISLDMSVRLAR